MGVVNNRISIDELESGGSGSIEQRLSHLEDEYTTLASYSTDEQLIGEWIEGSNIYRKVASVTSTTILTQYAWTDVPCDGLPENVKDIISHNIIGNNKSISALGLRVVDNNIGIWECAPNGYYDITEGSKIILTYTKNED